jgi:uncharacterized protein YjiS (DUF1127 family)
VMALKDFVSHFIQGVRGTVAFNRQVNNLNRLSDRDLQDIGVQRSDIKTLSERLLNSKTGV